MMVRISCLAFAVLSSFWFACTGGPGDLGDAGTSEGEGGSTQPPSGSGGSRPGSEEADATTRGNDASKPSEGATGLVGFCEHYFECGGSYFADVDDCVKQSLASWGDCRRPQLDTWGDCMIAKQKCEGWNPSAYNPRTGPCADEFAAVQSTTCE